MGSRILLRISLTTLAGDKFANRAVGSAVDIRVKRGEARYGDVSCVEVEVGNIIPNVA